MRDMNLIRKQAWSFHRTTGIDLEELISVATLGMIYGIKRYNKDKNTKFSTYVYSLINSQLIDYCKMEKRNRMLVLSEDLNSLCNQICYQPEFDFRSFLQLLPQDLKTIVDMALSSEEFHIPPKRMRGMIVQNLRALGWSWGRIWKGMKNIKSILNETEVGSIII